MNEAEINNFWQHNPCGAALVGDFADEERQTYADFFDRYDKYRYTKESHILTNLDRTDFRGKRVLEIGLGQGADAEQLIRRGAIYTGVDLTEESVKRVRLRFEIKGLEFEDVRQASVLSLPFDDDAFDIVFSHGVLHHVPEVKKASAEIARVLRPRGELIAMLYAKRSLNYLLSISVVRRLGLIAAYATGARGNALVAEHLGNAKESGLFNYLAMKNFIHRNTDGPGNPYSKVYSIGDVTGDFPDFDLIRSYRSFMHAPPLPVDSLPLASTLGWHLWVHLAPKKGILK
ncbi:MAG: class I SAM-dependent methyltransferase [Pyrinomonadaceae bacterium]